MKKGLSLLLGLLMCISLCACNTETSVTKEELLSSATTITAEQIGNDINTNIANAKEQYCNKILEITGYILSISEDHIELGYSRTIGTTTIDVYLPVEEIKTLRNSQQITIVGLTSDDIETKTNNVPMFGNIENKYIEMKQAFLVNDTFEIEGKLGGMNSSYAPSYNFAIDKDYSTYYLLDFAEDEDISNIGPYDKITITTKILDLSSNSKKDYKFVDARICK